jgi:hypothetical protein
MIKANKEMFHLFMQKNLPVATMKFYIFLHYGC